MACYFSLKTTEGRNGTSTMCLNMSYSPLLILSQKTWASPFVFKYLEHFYYCFSFNFKEMLREYYNNLNMPYLDFLLVPHHTYFLCMYMYVCMYSFFLCMYMYILPFAKSMHTYLKNKGILLCSPNIFTTSKKIKINLTWHRVPYWNFPAAKNCPLLLF